MIKFGTDGWRAVISDEFTFANVRLVAQAIARWVQEEAGAEQQPTMVVGFDTRFLSDRYAGEVARVLAANGIKTYLAKSDAPTPVVSFAVVEKQATGGVMITASHNPPRYNGIKLKAAYGGSASPAQHKRVEFYLAAALRNREKPAAMDYWQALESGIIERFDPFPAYQQHLRTLVDFDAIGHGGLRVVCDAMYGAGRFYLPNLLRTSGCDVVGIRQEMNPGFNGVHPEPIERYLAPLQEKLQLGGWDLGLATDGDADRIGAMTADGVFVTPHLIMALLLRYLVEQRRKHGDVVKTISTTMMLNRLADRYGIACYETPVGFNHIADLMLSNDILIGGEESGGISIKGHIPEGDGILMGLLLAEIVAVNGKPLAELVDDMQADVGPFFYSRHDYKTDGFSKAELVSALAAEPPQTLAQQPVVQVKTTDGVKYILADDSWLLIRPSGTEPILRVYAEAHDGATVHRLLQAGKRIAAPHLNGS